MKELARLDDLLVRAAAHSPEAVAIDDPGVGWLTFAQLEEAACSIAGLLHRVGLQEGDRVGLCAPKSVGSVAAIFGILKARGAYVPVDASAPPARSACIFEDCTVAALISTRTSLQAVNSVGKEAAFEFVSTIELPTGTELVLSVRSRPPAHRSTPPEQLAYILYTSGSTGTPKGVMHSHATALSFIDWCSEELRPTPQDRFSSHAPFHFDLSILDLYVPIKHGATIVLVNDDRSKQPLQLAPLIAESGISVWYSTPSILRLLVEFGKMQRFDYSALRLVLYAGEVFPPRHHRALRKLWPHPTYYNLYGPTETNVCTFDRVAEPPPDDYTGPLPIGSACSGDRLRVVAADGREVVQGEEGELLVTGGSVMLGYWNLPERNAVAFHEDADGTRWYRTGDVVVEDECGRYLFLGRRDRMVKRRGYRVELGEIEASLLRHAHISEAGAIAVPDPQSGVLIKVFVAWTEATPPSIIELKGIASSRLPAYMIPDRFVVLPALPKTSTDKLDYQKLRELN